jgi:hypothetical protein
MQHARITRDFLRRRTVQGAPHAADHAASHAGAHAAGQARASEGAATSLNRVARSKP